MELLRKHASTLLSLVSREKTGIVAYGSFYAILNCFLLREL